MPYRRLPKTFFDRGALEVAPDLIGSFLVLTDREGKKARHMITEVEAYDGSEDRASHASRGRTERTEVMFGAPGIFYVYLVYGMYNMLNVVTGPVDYPAAVLIRSVKEVSGPGRLTRDLGIDRAFNAEPATPKTGLWFESHSTVETPKITTTPRIGVDYAGEWAKKPYRFIMS